MLVLRKNYAALVLPVRVPIVPVERELPSVAKPPFEKIYLEDLFDTYAPTPDRDELPSRIDLIPAMPAPEIQEPPVPKDPEFLEPLTISLKGIMFSSEPDKSIALIADETGKETNYSVGESIKDAHIIKIDRERAILIRANGQQESLFLRVYEQPEKAADRWKRIVKKIDDTHFDVDIENFKTEVPSLGTLLQALSIATAYKNNQPIGLRVGEVAHTELGTSLGLQQQDIITKVQDHSVAQLEDRIAAFTQLDNLGYSDTLTITIQRDRKDIALTYKLARIEVPISPPFGKAPAVAAAPDLFKPNRTQQRTAEQARHDMVQRIERDNAINEIRRRILENMKRRQQTARIR